MIHLHANDLGLMLEITSSVAPFCSYLFEILKNLKCSALFIADTKLGFDPHTRLRIRQSQSWSGDAALVTKVPTVEI